MSVESRKNLLKNTVALSIPSAVNPLVSLALVYVISRRLGVVGTGEYYLLLSYINIFTTLACFGLGTLLVREIARRPEDINRLTANSLLFGLVTSVITIILMDFGVNLMNYGNELLLALVIGSLSLVPASASRFLEATFRAIGKSEFIALSQLLENVAKVILCMSVVIAGYGIVAISTMTVLTKFLALGVLLYSYFKVVGFFSARLNKRVWAMLIKEGPTFMGIAIFSTIQGNVDILMLSKLAGVYSAGIYGAAGRINLICLIVPMAFSLAILPSFSRNLGQGTKSLREKSELSIRYMLILCLPMAFGVIILAEKIIFMIYGDKFAQSVLILQLIAPTLIPYSLVMILAQTLIAANYQNVDLLINMLAAIAATVLNYFLIQRFAEVGAVMAGAATILMFLGFQIRFVHKNLFALHLFQVFKKPLGAALGMAILTYAFREANFFVNVLISATVYFALLFLMREFRLEEVRMVEHIIRRSSSFFRI